ncbi:hypothetical protein FRC07_001944 [Ceratobasidium sp. 392]|nr:hypothetical protein FRC07_001944 [Ceratobasidium sp. 392]
MFAGLAGAVGASNAGLDMSRAGVEVRFEWVRGRKRRRAVAREVSETDPSRTVGTGRRIRNGGGGGSRPVSVIDRPVSVLSVGGADGLDFSTVASESLSVPGPVAGRAPSVIASERSVSPDARRRSIDSHPRSRRGSKRSMSPMKKGAMARNDSGSSREREEDEDSDPEDSETPWSCTLRVLPLELPPPPSSDDLTSSSPPVDPSLPTGLKLRLAHLVPAPHHPKVIGQFKMPFPLPDVSVSRMELVHRAPGDAFGLGGGERVGVGRGEMVMTAEEIKDVVSTTGLWLMVREGFGGLGGKKRKGDGWKIRS